MTKTSKWFLGTLSFGVLSILDCHYLMVGGKDFMGRAYTKEDLIRNYEERGDAIHKLKLLCDSIIPLGSSVKIEFDGSDIASLNLSGPGVYADFRDVDMESSRVESSVKKFGWSQETLRSLRKQIEAAGCISIKSGKPLNIGYRESGMGKYSYNLFDRPLAGKERVRYNDSCSYILHNDSVVLEYGGGAVGRQCFE